MEKEMRRLKNIRNVTIIILLLAIIYSLVLMIQVYLASFTQYYPQEALGAVVNNWFDQFEIEMALRLYVFGLPIFIDIVVLITSCKEIKKKKLSTENNESN